MRMVLDIGKPSNGERVIMRQASFAVPYCQAAQHHFGAGGVEQRPGALGQRAIGGVMDAEKTALAVAPVHMHENIVGPLGNFIEQGAKFRLGLGTRGDTPPVGGRFGH